MERCARTSHVVFRLKERQKRSQNRQEADDQLSSAVVKTTGRINWVSAMWTSISADAWSVHHDSSYVVLFMDAVE